MVLISMTKEEKIGLLLFVAGIVFFLIGFSVPFWATIRSNERTGLWEYCVSGEHVWCMSTLNSRFNVFGDSLPSWFRGTQALACLALLTLLTDIAVRFLFLCGKPKLFCLVSVLLDFVTTVFGFLAAVVFGINMKDYQDISLGWGFAFNITGVIFLIAAGVFFMLEYIRRS